MPKIPSNYRALETSTRKPRAHARRTGPADPNEILTVSVNVRMRTDAPTLPAPEKMAAAPRGGKRFITRADFAAQYGASQADMDKITQFGAAHGLETIESNAARRTVVLKGAVAQMSEAFAVDLGMYETPDEKYRGREGNVHVPEDIADIVEGVFGLDNRRMLRPHARRASEPTAGITASPGTTPLTPPTVAGLYNFPTTPNASGQTIGIFEFGGGFNPTDVQLFYSSIGIAAVPSITAVSVDGTPNAPDNSGYTTETLLDIAVAGSTAPGAKLAVYFAPWTEQGYFDVVTTAITDTTNHPSVISISYGWPENDTFGSLDWTPAVCNAVSKYFQAAAAMGVTIFVSSGDQGSECQTTDHKAHVEYPGSDPYVTCCGGTSISNVSGASFTEHTWPGSGGGVSDIFPRPAWQSWAGVPGSVNDGRQGRGTPDIAGNADPASGYVLFQSGQNIGAVGGTSAVCPLYAGLTALINAGLDEPVGYLNPNLYAALPYTSVYRDINDGISNAQGGAPGYRSGPGWDACTGFGSVIGSGLAIALQGVGLRDAVSVASNLDGRLEAFAVGTDFGLYHNWQVSPGGAWSGWNPLGGVLTGEPAVGRNLDGRLEVFARGTDDALWHISQVAAGGAWSGWNSLGGVITSTPWVIQNIDGRLEVFARGTDGALWHRWQMAPGAPLAFEARGIDGAWSAWTSLSGVITSDPAVAQNNDGRLEAFARGTDNAVWHDWQGAPDGAWSGWNSLNGVITGIPAVSRNADGRLEIFARGSDFGLYHNWQVSTGGWSGWNPLGGVITSDPFAALNGDGRIEVFARGLDNALWHIWQVTAGGAWSGWNSLGGVITSDPFVGRNSDGRLEAFARGADDALWHIWQVTAGGAWSGWNSLGGVIVAAAAAHTAA